MNGWIIALIVIISLWLVVSSINAPNNWLSWFGGLVGRWPCSCLSPYPARSRSAAMI